MIYGHNGTIHGTRLVNVEIGPDGKVCSVWFRCMMLPFDETRVDEERAASMRGTYAPPLNAVDVTMPGETPVREQTISEYQLDLARKLRLRADAYRERGDFSCAAVCSTIAEDLE
jgi:hypothetical protein